MKKTLGIIGCGFIGTTLGKYAVSSLGGHLKGIVLFDGDVSRAETLKSLIGKAYVAGSAAELIGTADIVVECAAPDAVRPVLEGCVSKGKDAIIISVGGVLGCEDLLGSAREAGVRVILPSGAICGIDGIKAAGIAGITEAVITTRKGPASLKGAPYIKEKGIDLDALKGETVIFEGSAREAIKVFPKNINVSVLLSLAGIGADRTKVRIVTSPGYTSNTHEIEVKADSGRILIKCENVPSPDNPRTSYLAPLSCITVLKDYFDPVRIGA